MKWSKLLLRSAGVALLVSLLGVGCKGDNPTLPEPIPTTSPSTDPNPPFGGPLRATPGGFVDNSGRVVRLRGVSYVPPDSKLYGWPSWVTADILEDLRVNGGNFISARLGPYSRDGEGIEWVAYEAVGDLRRVNLDNWNPAFWSRVRSFVESAASRGIYVEFDLIDAWVLERPMISPWSQENNVNGYDGGNCGVLAANGPDLQQQRWLDKIAEELGRYPNVIFQISNESGEGNCAGALNPEWEIGVFRTFKNYLSGRGYSRPVGTNSHDSRVEAVVDYVERHGCSPVRDVTNKPSGVNEWNCAIDTARFCQIQRDLGPSNWFVLWGDGMTEGEWRESLKCLRSTP